MTQKKNCWEVKECGLGPGGRNTGTSGICPAAQPQKFDGYNNGKYFGRSCWMISKTRCNNKLQGDLSDKFIDCIECDFFKLVNEEESRGFVLLPAKELISQLKS